MAIDQRNWRQVSWLNRIQSLSLLAIIVGFLVFLWALLFSIDTLHWFFLVLVATVALKPSLSPQVLMKLYKAEIITPGHSTFLYQVIDELARAAHLPVMPHLYYVPSSTVNSFAVGSKANAVIAITDGMLQRLDRRELLGVLAHEVSHIKNNDLFILGVADTFSRLTHLLSFFGQLLLLINLPLILFGIVAFNWFAIILLIFAPSLSALSQLALSRAREYDADLDAIQLTDDPEGLALALAKIENIQVSWLERVLLPGRKVPDPSLLRTHPNTESRVARLLALRKGDSDNHGNHSGSIGSHHQYSPVRRKPRWHISGLWH